MKPLKMHITMDFREGIAVNCTFLTHMKWLDGVAIYWIYYSMGVIELQPATYVDAQGHQNPSFFL